MLFSVGHGTQAIGSLLSTLNCAGVRRLVDVRVAPGSRRNPQFAAEALRRSAERDGIEYRWVGTELGGFRRPKIGSRHTALRVDAFRGYADHMETSVFREGLARLLSWGRELPTAFLCAEADWRRCHRRMIADAIVAGGGRVRHLVDGRIEEHELHPQARLEDGRLVYDGGVQATLM